MSEAPFATIRDAETLLGAGLIPPEAREAIAAVAARYPVGDLRVHPRSDRRAR